MCDPRPAIMRANQKALEAKVLHDGDLIRGVLVLGLVFVHDLYVIYVILFTMSVVSAFFVPAQSVAVRTLVPMAGLMAEVVEAHVRTHLVDAEKHPGALNIEATEQLLEVVRTYLK